MLESIPTKSIFHGGLHRLRRVDPAKVTALANSIKEIGLQSPISVRAVARPEGTPCRHNGYIYYLVAGDHRLEACRKLGMTEISAFLLDADDATCRLWEIDENLIRAELNELERAEHLRERKFWYEKLHEKTKHGANRTPCGQFGHTDGDCFVDDTAAKIGISARDVRRSVHRAEAIAPEVKDAISDMPEIADKGVELDALAAVEPEDQKAAVEAVKSGKARNVREATKGAKKRRRRCLSSGGNRRPRKPRNPGKFKDPTDEELLSGRVLEVMAHYEQLTGKRVAGIEIDRTDSLISGIRIIHASNQA